MRVLGRCLRRMEAYCNDQARFPNRSNRIGIFVYEIDDRATARTIRAAPVGVRRVVRCSGTCHASRRARDCCGLTIAQAPPKERGRVRSRDDRKRSSFGCPVCAWRSRQAENRLARKSMTCDDSARVPLRSVARVTTRCNAPSAASGAYRADIVY